MLRSLFTTQEMLASAAGDILSDPKNWLNPFSFLGESIKLASDFAQWQNIYFGPEKSCWTNKNEIVLDDPAFYLRAFHPPKEILDNGTNFMKFQTPILINIARAGHRPCYLGDTPGKGKSLVERCMRLTGQTVYALDWKEENSNGAKDLDDLARQLDRAVEHLGVPVNMPGLCQGGWASLMYGLRFPEKVNSLILAGSPIDCNADRNNPIQSLLKIYPQEFYEWLVTCGGGTMPGECMVAGFVSFDKKKHFADDPKDLFRFIRENKLEELEKSKHFIVWYRDGRKVGPWILPAVQYLFRDNLFFRGKLKLLGKRIDPRELNIPTVMMAGENDNITSINEVFNLALVMPASTPRLLILIPQKGHIGIFTSASSGPYWEQALRFIHETQTRVSLRLN